MFQESHTSSLDPSLSRRDRDSNETNPSRPMALLDSVEKVSRQARTLLLRQAWSRWAILVMSVVLLGVLFDIFLQLPSHGPRWGVAVVWLMAAAVGYWVWIRPACKREDLLTSARWIEKSLPDLGDRLSTTVELLQANNEKPTKPPPTSAYRELAIANTCRDLQPDRFTLALDTKPTRILLRCALVVAGLVVIAALFPAVRFAATRLSLPFLPLDWPHPDRLELIVPARVHAASTVTVEVVDHQSPLPTDVVLLVKSPEGTVENFHPKLLSKDRAQWKLKKIPDRTRLRAIGGVDRSMPWHTIDVIPAPDLVEYQWRIIPPTYTGRIEQFASGQHLDALVGSAVTLELKFDQELQAVQCISDKQDGLEGMVERTTFTGDAFRIEFRSNHPKLEVEEPADLGKASVFFIQLTDQHGIASTLEGSWQLRFVGDLPPQVSWLQPTQDLVVSARAKVHFQWEAEDDLTVVQTELRSEQVPSSLLPRPTEASSEALSNARRMRAEWQMDLEQLPTYRPGETLVLEASATDQLGQLSTTTRRIRIASDPQIEQLAVELQQQAFRFAQRAVQRQQKAMEEVARAIDQTPAVQQEEIVRILEEVAIEQRAAADDLAGTEDSASDSLLQARQLLKQNRVAEEREKELQNWSEESKRIARRMTDVDLASPDLQQISDHQQMVLADLEKLLEELGAANDAAKSVGAFDDVRRRQAALNELTAGAKRSGEASPQLAKEQRQLAPALERVIDQLRRSTEERAMRAADRVEQEGTSLEMLEAAAAIDRQQLELATASQERIRQALDAAQAALSGTQSKSTAKGDQDFLRRVRRLRDRQHLIVEQLHPSRNPLHFALEESALANETQQVSDQAVNEPSIQEALRDVVTDLQMAAVEFAREDGTDQGHQAARDALARLDAIVAALDLQDPAPRKATPPDSKDQPSQESSENDQPQVSETQLRLWRNLQVWLQQQTVETVSSAEGKQRQNRIAAHQDQLAQQAESGGASAEIPQQMRTSSDRLRAGDIPQARDSQQQTIDRLDDLIEKIQQASEQADNQTEVASERRQSKAQADSPAMEQQSEQDQKRELPERSDSTAIPGSGDPGARGNIASGTIIAPRPAEALSRGVWGHLPERVRREIDAITTEQYHPKYRRLIEDYYRRLSELEP